MDILKRLNAIEELLTNLDENVERQTTQITILEKIFDYHLKQVPEKKVA